MTFRVDRLVSEENVIVLHVSGRVHIECVNTTQGTDRSGKRQDRTRPFRCDAC